MPKYCPNEEKNVFLSMAVYCPDCGAKLIEKPREGCPGCGWNQNGNNHYCISCGAKLISPVAEELPIEPMKETEEHGNKTFTPWKRRRQ